MASAFEIVGDLVGGNAAKKEAEFNGAALDRQAANTRIAATRNAGEFAESERRAAGDSRANAGGSGATQSGSVRDVTRDVDSEVVAQTQKIIQGGDEEARTLRNQAKLTRVQGKNAKARSRISALTKTAKFGASNAPEGSFMKRFSD